MSREHRTQGLHRRNRLGLLPRQQLLPSLELDTHHERYIDMWKLWTGIGLREYESEEIALREGRRLKECTWVTIEYPSGRKAYL
ncbi:hypothetical protein SEA_BLINN1_98 [Mycobacterium phage Blinn1]|uniref:Uncharacterized protein n=1 Tax=Mycobacterium phage Blinn1 TaxID=2656562 RepID=A0A649VRB9_9CAUD|nr:hypothetical protein KIP53_gp011 [Mycobacterium phage Blinn1]QGJ94858.1 hypothetical protein SEA_BLINN1_98 [Mycobacterium phage Blinn1]